MKRAFLFWPRLVPNFGHYRAARPTWHP